MQEHYDEFFEVSAQRVVITAFSAFLTLCAAIFKEPVLTQVDGATVAASSRKAWLATPAF